MVATATEPAQTVNEIVVKIIINPEWLKWKRLTAGVKQTYIAELCRVSPSHIGNIECGRTVCSQRVLKVYQEL